MQKPDQIISMGKSYVTRDGRAVRIYAVDAGGREPVHGAVQHSSGWEVNMWRANGTHELRYLDLIEVKPKVKVDCLVVLNESGSPVWHGIKPPSAGAQDWQQLNSHYLIHLQGECEPGGQYVANLEAAQNV